MKSAAFSMRKKPLLELASVRGDSNSGEFRHAVAHATGIELPRDPNTVALGETYIVLWLGPDEWLLQSTGPREATLERTLRPLLAGRFAAVVDVSSGSIVVEVRGSRARDVLQKGCPLDLHPRVLGIGQCAQSHFFKAAIVLRPLAADTFEVILRRSYADYASRMLIDAAEEFTHNKTEAH
jgi:sarcosine oxidase subunit gamma